MRCRVSKVFILLEIILAVAIVSIALFAILGAFSNVVRIKAKLLNYSRALFSIQEAFYNYKINYSGIYPYKKVESFINFKKLIKRNYLSSNLEEITFSLVWDTPFVNKLTLYTILRKE